MTSATGRLICMHYSCRLQRRHAWVASISLLLASWTTRSYALKSTQRFMVLRGQYIEIHIWISIILPHLLLSWCSIHTLFTATIKYTNIRIGFCFHTYICLRRVRAASSVGKVPVRRRSWIALWEAGMQNPHTKIQSGVQEKIFHDTIIHDVNLCSQNTDELSMLALHSA